MTQQEADVYCREGFQKVLDTWDSAPGPGWEERAASPGLTLSPSCLGEKEELPANLSNLAAPRGVSGSGGTEMGTYRSSANACGPQLSSSR